MNTDAIPGLGQLSPKEIALFQQIQSAQRDLYYTLRGEPVGSAHDPLDAKAVFARVQIDALAKWATRGGAENYQDLLCGGRPPLWQQFVVEADALLEKFRGGRHAQH